MIDIAASLPSGGDYFSLTMIGGTGAAYADDHHNMNLLYSGGQPNAIRTSQGRADLAGQLQEFVEEVPIVVQQERLMEVPEVQYVEIVKQQPAVQYQERIKEIAKFARKFARLATRFSRLKSSRFQKKF